MYGAQFQQQQQKHKNSKRQTQPETLAKQSLLYYVLTLLDPVSEIC